MTTPIVFNNRSSTSKLPTFRISCMVSTQRLKENPPSVTRIAPRCFLLKTGRINPNGINPITFPARFKNEIMPSCSLYRQNLLISRNSSRLYLYSLVSKPVLPYASEKNKKYAKSITYIIKRIQLMMRILFFV